MFTTLPQTIKALQIQPNKTVKVVDIPWASQSAVQNLAAEEVIVRVRAVGLNPTDWKHAFGTWGTPGTISGCDAAGDIVKVGPAVMHLNVGDRVAGMNFGGSWQTDNGAYAQYVRFKAAATFKIPDGMTYEEGASMPIPHLTAAQALFMRLPLPKPFAPGTPFKEKILIWGGSTAVGHHAVQLAALAGAEVIVAASEAVHEELKRRGAAHCVDYRSADVVQKIKEIAGPEGVTYGLDTVSENGTTNYLVDAMSEKRGGTVITLLPVSEEIVKRRQDVHVEFTLVYTLLGYEFNFAGTPLPASIEDNRRSYAYVSETLPHILEGWKAGEGSSALKPQCLRHLDGGLEGIHQGFEIMSKGAYGREKLVYTIQ